MPPIPPSVSLPLRNLLYRDQHGRGTLNVVYPHECSLFLNSLCVPVTSQAGGDLAMSCSTRDCREIARQ